MRIFLVVLTAAFLYFAACSDDGDSGNNTNSEYTIVDGKITGWDATLCMCCGGWFVKIDTDTMRIFNMPSEFSDTLSKMDMPVDVRFGWKDLEDGCGENNDVIILINFIELR